ncbi:MAG: hypothetical protein ACRC5H_03350 [Treponemataceae bacterium]
MDAFLFWQNVNILIKAKNTTQEAISNTCGINFGTLKNQSSKKVLPDVISAYKISKALNTTVEYLVTGNLPSQDNRINNLKQQLLEVISNY